MGRDTRDSPAGEKKLEQYGVWVKAGPREVPEASAADESIGLSDLDTPIDAGEELPDITDESPLTTEEEKLLDELETELEPAGADAKDLPELTLEPGAGDEVEVALSDSLPAEEHFDDLQALEDELASVTGAAHPGPAAAAAGSAAAGHSTEVLARIEEELRSIRTDLTELKKELAGLRAPGASAPRREPSAQPEAGRAFFDEDEDETIALTGDELDNILNTADITEGTAEAAAPDLEAPSADSLHLEPLEEPSDADALELPAAGPAAADEDILGYETPILEEDRLVAVEPLDADDDLAELEAGPEGPDLAADLVLETLPASPGAKDDSGLDALGDLDLEALPEIEDAEPAAGLEGEDGGAAELEAVELDAGDAGTADLEPLEDLEAPAGSAAREETGEPGDTVDLEALAREAEEEIGPEPLGLDVELETAELEPVAEEGSGRGGIEIDFETDKDAPAPADAEPVEELLEVEEVPEVDPAPAAPAAPAPREGPRPPARPEPRQEARGPTAVPDDLKEEIRSVLQYMDHLLEALPEDKVEEFARSEYYAMYHNLFKELGLGE